MCCACEDSLDAAWSTVCDDRTVRVEGRLEHVGEVGA
jgi:hypothetical protein